MVGIRSAVVKDDVVYAYGGAGIVKGSKEEEVRTEKKLDCVTTSWRLLLTTLTLRLLLVVGVERDSGED